MNKERKAKYSKREYRNAAWINWWINVKSWHYSPPDLYYYNAQELMGHVNLKDKVQWRFKRSEFAAPNFQTKRLGIKIRGDESLPF